MTTDPSPRYRIEYRSPGHPQTVLAEADAIVPAMVLARAHALRLRAADATGAIAIVNQRDGYNVLVRAVRAGWSLTPADDAA
jgi:hypothetical protein